LGTLTPRDGIDRMNDNATAMAGSVRAVLSGLPQRLVLDGLIDEAAMLDAMASARERKTHLVSWLVSHDLAAARDIAIAASQEFGVPLLDLDAVAYDLDTVRLVSDKLLAKHRILPLIKRGKRLHVAVSDPTNLHAVDEIKFQTGLAIEAVVVEDDKLQQPPYTILECQEQGLTYSVPVKVKLRLSTKPNAAAKEYNYVLEQDGYLGNLPCMTTRGSFIINGAERVIVSQLHR
jgi:hypothetical protein